MAGTTTTPGALPGVTEKTFTGYNASQANTYSEHRRNYHSSVYDFVLEHHRATGGNFDTVVDVGCGPGTVTRTLAPHFKHAIGLDPSPALLDVARNHPSNPSNITYHASTSSTFHPDPIPTASASLITVGNAAHWFPSMSEFYHLASQALQPGGTLAMWCNGDMRVAPDLPNAEKIQAAMDHHIDVELKEWVNEGNILVRGGYAEMESPWGGKTIRQAAEEGEGVGQGQKEEGRGGEESPSEETHALDRATFVRREWGVREKFYAELPGEDKGVGLGLVEAMLATGSAQTRWRQAHPEIANTDQDILKKLVAKIGELLREAGVKPGEERVRGTASGVVLLFKKKQVDTV